MKRFFLFAVLLLCVGTLAAQVKFPCEKQMAKGKFEKAEKSINKGLAKNPDDVMFSYAYFRLLSDLNNPKADVRQAYGSLVKSIRSFDKLDEGGRAKLLKKNMSRAVLTAELQKTTEAALVVAERANTVQAYEDFLDFYKASITGPQLERANNGRNAIEFAQAKEQNTVEGYQRFIDRRPAAKERAEAERLRNVLAYEETSKVNTIEAYERFVQKYPKAKEVPMAQQQVYQLAFRDATESNKESKYREYAKKYPESPLALEATRRANRLQFAGETESGDWNSYKRYINNHPQNKELVAVAQEEIFRVAKKTHNIEILDYCVRKFSGDLQDSAAYLLHAVYLDNPTLSAVRDFLDTYRSYLPSSLEELDELILEAVEYVQEYDLQTFMDLIRVAAPHAMAYQILVAFVKDYIDGKQWDEAVDFVRQFADNFGDDHRYNDLVATLSAPIEPDVKVVPLPNTVNTYGGDEYDPVITADDHTLYFCAKNRSDNYGGEDIYFSKRDSKGRWMKAKPLPALNTSYGNEAPVSVSADGTTMLLFQSGKLYASEKEAIGWQEAEELSSNINICDWQADAMITSDGQAMIFAARKKVDSEVEESTNIFVSVMDQYGRWGEPIDLGPTINTAGTDRSPFMHPDMKTLYFCSDGHSTLGGLDVFKSTRLSDTSWTEWSEPVNMGKQINTTDQDCWYRISTDGKTAYFSKNSEGENICQMNIPKRMRPNMVATVSGTLTDKDKKPVSAEIRWEDLQSGETMGHSKTDPVDGSFFIVLPLGRIYGYYVDDDSYFPISNSLDLREEESAVKVEEDISIISFKQMIDEGLAVPVNNLFFNVAKHELLPYSLPELRRVAQIIKKQGLRVEIAGHTDNTGSDELNQTLSEQRAQAVKDYLVKQGCDPDKLTTVGYGSTKAMASNKNEEGRKLNRRVELRFLGNDEK